MSRSVLNILDELSRHLSSEEWRFHLIPAAYRIRSNMLQNIRFLKREYQTNGVKNLNINVLLDQYNDLGGVTINSDSFNDLFISKYTELKQMIDSEEQRFSKDSERVKRKEVINNGDLYEEIQGLKGEMREMKQLLKILIEKK